MKSYKVLACLLTVFLILAGCSIFTPAGQTTQPQSEAPVIRAPTDSPALETRRSAQDEPVLITGDIPFTSPFFLNTTSEPFVLLEDEAGFVRRDREFRFSLSSQTIGPAELSKEGQKLTYSLALPSVPQATMVDVDNNGKKDLGVQVFQVAYWSNTWGGPFLEERDGKGWSTAYSSAITDPENKDEIVGGILVVWGPDNQQSFPSGFGADKKLFTSDDPVAPIPAGYNLVDLNKEPFKIYKERNPKITLNEGAGAVKDFSKLGYSEAFEALFKRMSVEYPFTKEKGIDWQALYNKYQPQFAKVKSDKEFYSALRDFATQIPDGHVNVSLNRDAFYASYGGGFGLVLVQLSDQSVIVKEALTGLPGAKAGIQAGAQIIEWNGLAVAQAIEQVTPGFGPYSTNHTRHLAQVNFLAHTAPGSEVSVTYKNPGSASEQTATLQAANEVDSLFRTIPSFNSDPVDLPIVGRLLPEIGLGYIKIDSFSDDYRLLASVWQRYIQNMIDNKVPGLVIDLRDNSGGSLGLAMDFAGFFFKEEATLYEEYYYSDTSGKFESTGYPTRIVPAPIYYDGPIAVLVSPDCVSACEGFAYALRYNQRSTVVGFYPTAGAFGEVGLGQYMLPGGINMQFPTGKPVAPDGSIVIEGVGVKPDITVPVTAEGVLGQKDTLLDAAVQMLLKEIR